MKLKKQIFEACKKGDIDEINNLSKREVDYNYGLYGACIGKHKNVIDLMISKGANDFMLAYMGACEGGDMEIIKNIFQRIKISAHSNE